MYLNHITLHSGHTARAERSAVRDDVLALVAPWLMDAINSGKQHPLPVPELSHLSCSAAADRGGLLVTVFAPDGPHVRGKPNSGGSSQLVTFGVAQRSRQGAELWPLMLANLDAAPEIKKPPEPWIATALHPALFARLEEASWLADFEQCVAWAWITRNPAIESAT